MSGGSDHGRVRLSELMLWGVEDEVVDRYSQAGVQRKAISFERDTYTFRFPTPPADLVAEFRDYYGPTMNAFEAAAAGREQQLHDELVNLFTAQNTSGREDITAIPATYLRVTVAV